MADYISKYTGSQIDGKLDYANMAYATCEDEAATAAKTAIIVGNENWELKVGSIVIVNFTVANSAQENVTLNVNGTGAKSVYYNNTQVGTSYYSSALGKGYNMYMYNGTDYVWMGHSIDSNTTYSQASLGQGYGTCSTAAATVAKTVSMSSYSLKTGGIVAIKFTNAVPASATLSINSQTAKPIWYNGAVLKDGVIHAGDTATLIYDGTNYILLAIDSPEQLFTGTIAVADWTQYSAYADVSITVDGLNSSTSFDVDLNLPATGTMSVMRNQISAWGNVMRVNTTADNTVRFLYDGTAPTVDLPIKIRWRR